MFSTDDTIVAIATPPGRGGIGVVRLSGPRAVADCGALTGATHSSRGTRRSRPFSSAARAPIDQAVVTYFPAPHSYTGEDVVEISAHGSPGRARRDRRGGDARPARGWPIPASSRCAPTCTAAWIWCRRKLSRSSIDAVTPLQARVAFDQLEGTLTARAARDGRGAARSVAPLEASLDFPEEGYHFITTATRPRAALDAIRGSMDALLADAAARPRDPRRPDGGDRRAAERREIEPVQSPGRRGARHRHGRAGDDAGSADREGGHRRRSVHARSTPRAFAREPANAIEEEGIARARQAAAAADVMIVVARSIARADRRRSSC